MKNEALKFLKKICKNRVKVTKRMVIFFLMTGGLLLSQVNFSETVDETKPATIKDLKDYDYPNSLHFVSVQYSDEDVKEYKDYNKYLDLLKEKIGYLKEVALEEANGKDKKKIKEINQKARDVKKQMDKLKETNKLISQKVSNKIEGKFKTKDSEEINKEYTERMNEINKLGTNFNNLGIDFAHSIAIGKGAEIKGENGIAIGVDTLSGKDSISLGKDAIADGEGNIAIGRDATLFSKTFKGKVGQQIARILNTPDTIVKFENEGNVEYKKTIVIGDGTKSSGNSNIAIGDNAIAMKKRLTLSTKDNGVLSDKNGAEIDAKNWNDIAKQFYSPGEDDKGYYKFEVKPVENAIALGKNASAFADNVIAIGKGAISGFESAVSIGENADTEGKNSVAIGKNSIIFGESSVAIGEGSRTGKIKYVLKTIEGKDTVEKIEEFDTLEAAKQELEKKNDLSKIYRIEVGGEKSEYSVAIGKDSAVEHSGSVAIGADSLAVKSNGKSAFTEVDHTSGETVSFGKEDRKRRLTNVADGSADSDAVTVAQLKKAINDNKGGSGGSAVDSKLKLSDGKETKDLSLKDDTLEIANGTNTTVTLTKDEAKKKATFKVDVKGDLTGITSITNGNEDSANKNSKIKLEDDKLTLTNKGKSIKILTKETNGDKETLIEFDRALSKPTSKKGVPQALNYGIGTINYLKDRKASKDDDYGIKTNIGRAATEGAVKEVDSKINVVYTDKDGNKLVGLVKAKDNKYYKAEYVDNKGELKEEYKNEEGKESKDIFATLLNPDGTTNNLTTKLRVADGNIAADSKDAINGGQLNTELEKKLDKTDLDVKGDGKYITVKNTDKKIYTVSFNDAELKNTVSSSDLTNNTSIQTLLSKKADIDATNVTGDNLTKWQATLGTGTIDANSTGLVTGKTVFNYIDPINTKVNQFGTSLNDKLSDINITGDDYIKATKGNTKGTYTLAFNKDNLQTLINSKNFNLSNNDAITNINTELGKKANKDATNLDNTDVTKWQEKLGNGTMTDNNAGLVKGGVVKKYVDDQIKGSTSTINTTLDKKLNKEDLDVKGDSKYITVTPSEDKTKKIYTVSFNDAKLKNTVSGSDLTNNTSIKTLLSKKADIDATNVTGDNLTKWQATLGTGTIDANSTGLVTGKTVFNYIDPINTKVNQFGTSLNDKLSDINITGDDYIKATKGNTKGTYTLAFNKDNLQTLINSKNFNLSNNDAITNINTELGKKANKDATNLDNTDVTKWQEKLGNGTMTDNNAGLVKGGVVKKYVDDQIKGSTSTINTTLDKKINKDDLDVKGDSKYITVTNTDKKIYTVSFNDAELKNTVSSSDLTNNTSIQTLLSKKADIDATNITGDNLTKWQSTLGTGTIDANSTGLVTGGTVYTKLNEVKTDLDNKYTTLNTQVTTNTGDITALKTDVKDLKKTKQDITNINTKLDGKLDKADLSITGDDYITATKGNKFDYTLKVNKTKLESDLDLTNNTSVNNMFTNKLGNINTNIGDLKNEVENNKDSINKLTTKVDNNTNDITTLKQDMTKKLDADANNLSADGITNLTNKLSKDSNIAKPKDRLVTDKQVNTYLSRYNDALGVVDKKSTVALEKSELALGGVANAVAMANLVQVNSYSRHRHNLSAAYGYYGGSHALAVGFSGTNEERNFVYKLSGSVNNKGNLAFGVGAGVMLGNKDERLTTEYSTKLKSVEKDLVEANKKIKEYEERQKATDIKVKELERKLNQILNKH